MTIKSSLKSAFNRLVLPLGFELVRMEPDRKTMTGTLAAASRRGLSPRTVIDVGVAYGTPELYAAFPQADLLMIEPLNEWEPVMKSIAAERGNAHYVVAAAGAETGSVTLAVPEFLAWASAKTVIEGSEQRVVPMTTVDEEVARLGLQGPFVLKIDVEGFEGDVLKGATETLKDCQAVLLETFADTTFAPLVHQMYEAGFVIHDLYELGYRADEVLYLINTVFAPAGGELRAELSHVEGDLSVFLEEQAEILRRVG